MTQSLLKVLLGVEERLALPPQRQPTGICKLLSPLETAKPLLSLNTHLILLSASIPQIWQLGAKE